ncbi:MAG: c-type cytochrome [Rhizobiaceae bacterium]
MKKLALAFIFLAIAGAVAFYVLTIPSYLEESELQAMSSGDAAKGERMFWAGGCASCHAAKGAKDDDKFELGGGLELATPFGSFYAPNISTDTQNGIGDWTGAEFANAMMKGVSPNGSHYYPAFPYTSYTRMKIEDVADLWAFLQTLPAVSRENDRHDLPLVFRFRRGLGLWKLLFLTNKPIVEFSSEDPQVKLGQYLTEGPAHCGECHTPRDFIGGMELSKWLGGGPAPEGEGKIPNITPDTSGIGSWTKEDIVFSLESGLTPDYDVFGGEMVSVQQNMAKLTPEDRQAIAAYLKAIPAVGSY